MRWETKMYVVKNINLQRPHLHWWGNWNKRNYHNHNNNGNNDNLITNDSLVRILVSQDVHVRWAIKTTENFRTSRIYPDRRILWWIFLNKYHINLLWSHQLFSKKKTFRSKNVNIPTTSAWSSISCETWFTCTAERPIRICTISVWRTWTGIRRTFVDIYVK
mgnify:CR=1 FL=1